MDGVGDFILLPINGRYKFSDKYYPDIPVDFTITKDESEMSLGVHKTISTNHIDRT